MKALKSGSAEQALEAYESSGLGRWRWGDIPEFATESLSVLRCRTALATLGSSYLVFTP